MIHYLLIIKTQYVNMNFVFFFTRIVEYQKKYLKKVFADVGEKYKKTFTENYFKNFKQI